MAPEKRVPEGDEWYYQVEGGGIGPVSSAELKQAASAGVITGETPVRKGTHGAWARAKQVKGLFERASSQPAVTTRPGQISPEPPQSSPPPIPIDVQPLTHAKSPHWWVLVAVAGSGIVIVVLALALYGLGGLIERKSPFRKGSPEHVLYQYANATSWQERLRYVKQTEGIREKIVKHYGNKPIKFQYDEIQKCDSINAKIGDVVTVDVIVSGPNAFGSTVSETLTYYLEKTPKGYVILWEPSTHWLPMGWVPYLASRPAQPMDFPLLCTLGTSFYATREEIKRTHFSVEIRADTKIGIPDTVQAFVVKNSPAGKKIFEVLKDGQAHQMILTIQFRENVDEACVWITRVISDKPWVYDEQMARRYTSPILSSPSEIRAKPSEIPFKILDLTARWTISENVLGGTRLVVPEVRFRVTAISAPIRELRIKIVYLEKREDGTEILGEDVQYVVSSSERPLEKGFMKLIISSSEQGYRAAGLDRVVLEEAIHKKTDVEAELYYDTGDGYVKFKTVSVAKELAYY